MWSESAGSALPSEAEETKEGVAASSLQVVKATGSSGKAEKVERPAGAPGTQRVSEGFAADA